VQFRTLFASGTIPALVVLVASLRDMRTAGAGGSSSSARDGSNNLSQALRDITHWRTLIGTAGTWFLFDVAFYGMVIFMPSILKKVFGAQQTLGGLALRAAFMSVLGILGSAAGILALPKMGAKAMNTAGLACGGILFVICMLLFEFRPEWHGMIFFVLCLLFLVLWSGPNVATFILPVISYPSEVRSTFHGLSAAAAKLGAMAGSLLFPIIDDFFGTTVVMATQALICATAALVSHFCLRSCPEAVTTAAPPATGRDVELSSTVERRCADVHIVEATQSHTDEQFGKSCKKVEKQKLIELSSTVGRPCADVHTVEATQSQTDEQEGKSCKKVEKQKLMP